MFFTPHGSVQPINGSGKNTWSSSRKQAFSGPASTVFVLQRSDIISVISITTLAATFRATILFHFLPSAYHSMQRHVSKDILCKHFTRISFFDLHSQTVPFVYSRHPCMNAGGATGRWKHIETRSKSELLCGISIASKGWWALTFRSAPFLSPPLLLYVHKLTQTQQPRALHCTLLWL